MKKAKLPGTGLDDIIVPVSNEYYDRLHDKIMARIEETDMAIEAQSISDTKTFKVKNFPVAERVRLWLQTRNT